MITLKKATEISKEKIETLRPEMKAKAYRWFDLVYAAGITAYVYEGLRSGERQNELFAKGRSTEGPIVTNAMAGQSFHNYGLAFDWVPLKRVDKAEGMYEPDWENTPAYQKGNAIGAALGMRQISWETPHLEDASYANWRELKMKFGEANGNATA